MASGFESILNEAMAAVYKQRDELMRQQQSLNEITATVRSGRRQVSATVDARGELVDLKFHGQSYKNMSPDDLGRLVVDTVRQARHDAQTQMWESMADTLPEGAEIADVVSGRYDWSDALGEALTVPKPLMDLLSHPPEGINPPEGMADGVDFAAFFESMMRGGQPGESPAEEAQAGEPDADGPPRDGTAGEDMP